MTSLTCCISIVVSPPCGSSSFPVYRGLALVKTMPSSLLPLVFICFTPVQSTWWACTRALKYVVHAYFYCAIHNERWTLISFRYICVPACHLCCGYTLTVLPFLTLSYYPRTQHPPCPLYQATTIGVGLSPSIMGARRRNLRLAHGSADSGCLRAHRYLHHAPLRLHPASHPHNTLACKHSPLPPPCVLPPPTHPHLPTHHFLQIYWS